MARTRTLLASTFALLLAASTASAATITFTFFTGTGYTHDLPTNIGQDSVADLCGGGNLDICAPMLQFVKNGVTLSVTATRSGGSPTNGQVVYVNEDLTPVWGGLGVDGGNPNPGDDNIGPGENLFLTFSQPVYLKSFIAFRDHENYYNSTGQPDTTITVLRDTLPMQSFNVPIGKNALQGGTVPDLPNLGNALFNFSPTFAGSIFDFSINAETFYISQLTVETVPEPTSLLLVGMALLGGVRSFRRRRS